MTTIRIIQIWCWLLLILIHTNYSSSTQAQFMSFCSRPLNMTSSLSIIFTPSLSSYPSCCNITLVKPSLSDLSEQITINILNMSTTDSALKIFNKQQDLINFTNYLLSNRTYLKSDILSFPLTLNLCQFNIQSFEILLTNITKGPCKSNQYRCLTANQEQWCIDETNCDKYPLCPQGMEESGCTKSMSKITLTKMTRTIRGGVVTTIIVLGLLLIIGSVSIAVAFIYFRRKNQRRRQLAYSLESTSDDWEPSGAGYHLFNNWTNNRRHTRNNIDNVIIDANEHMPIATNMTNR